MNKTYRIELVYQSGQKIVWGYTSASLELIEKSMNKNLKQHPIVNVYAKTGKRIIATYQG